VFIITSTYPTAILIIFEGPLQIFPWFPVVKSCKLVLKTVEVAVFLWRSIIAHGNGSKYPNMVYFWCFHMTSHVRRRLILDVLHASRVRVCVYNYKRVSHLVYFGLFLYMYVRL
jgi:hypothetical protein